ncbi:MAG: amidohydrolase family protein, partial [Candidatus Heimdallarchaeota archaeon]|nr:amidohydrolase family protein [Candidatus Heimdallarchaeota archaeon]
MERLVIKNANYLDVHSGGYKENKVIVMKDRKIAWIGDEGSFENEEKDQMIDASGKFIIPGMIDGHVHLDFPGGVNMERYELNTPTSAYNYEALINAQKHLISGFTTVRDVGTFSNSYPAIKNTIATLQFAGSRILGSHHILAQKGTQENERPDYIDRSMM